MLYKELQPDGKIEINSINAINPDIITAIENNYSKSVKQVKNFAQQFRSDLGTYQTAYNVWCFLRKKIRYVKDGETQKIKLPSRFLSDKTGDCKSFSLFAASVLGALDIPVAFRYASYKEQDPTPSHVYITCQDEAGREIIIDGCFNKFNEEKKYQHKIDHRMDVITLSDDVSKIRLRDLKESDPDLYNRVVAIIQEIKKYAPGNDTRRKLVAELKRLLSGIDYSQSINGNKKKNKKDKKASGLKKVALSPARNAFLSLVALNIFGIASRLNKASLAGGKDAIAKKWKKLGGNADKLFKAVAKGAKKKPILAKKVSGIDGIGAAPIAAGAVIIAAAPVMVAVLGLLKSLKGGEEIPGVEEAGSVLSELGASLESADNYEVTDAGKGADNSGLSTTTMLLIGAAVVGGILLIKK